MKSTLTVDGSEILTWNNMTTETRLAAIRHCAEMAATHARTVDHAAPHGYHADLARAWARDAVRAAVRA